MKKLVGLSILIGTMLFAQSAASEDLSSEANNNVSACWSLYGYVAEYRGYISPNRGNNTVPGDSHWNPFTCEDVANSVNWDTGQYEEWDRYVGGPRPARGSVYCQPVYGLNGDSPCVCVIGNSDVYGNVDGKSILQKFKYDANGQVASLPQYAGYPKCGSLNFSGCQAEITLAGPGNTGEYPRTQEVVIRYIDPCTKPQLCWNGYYYDGTKCTVGDRCNDGYYGSISTTCTKCPNKTINGVSIPMTAPKRAGTTLQDCYIPKGTYSDATGTFQLLEDCY